MLQSGATLMKSNPSDIVKTRTWLKKTKGGTELSEQPQRAAVVQEVQLEGFNALCYTS